MKLRIKGNSLRLRLLRGEVEQLRATGKVIETIQFGLQSTQKLVYLLQASYSAEEITASFAQNKITVTLPDAIAREWIRSDEVSLTAEQKISDSEVLKILVEKDFVCVDRAEDEDSKDAFPHPALNCEFPAKDGQAINDYGKTSEKIEEPQISGAHQAANEADNHQASHWTAGKEDIRSENEIALEAV